MASVVVIGAGLAGATVALALAQAGHEVDLCEQAASLLEVGAGVSLSPNAVRALEYLGLAQAVEEVADLPGPGAILHYRTGELLRMVGREDDFPGRGRAGFMQLCRADLLAVIVKAVRATPAVRLHLGQHCTGFAESAGRVCANFASGATFEGELLIGCDGLRSQVRSELFGSERPRFTGQTAWRCLVPVERVARHLGAGPSALYIGPKRLVNRYCVRHRQLVNVVAIARTDRMARDGWLERSSFADFLQEYVDWHEDVTEIVRHAPEGSLYAWSLFDRDPLSRWGRGRIALAGDAAHPMLPFLGLGAALGIEDAVVLARCISLSGTTPAALARYERARVEHCARALKDSRLQGELYQAADPEHYGAVGRLSELRLRYFNYDAARVVV